jgi:hypothetical protein
MGQENEPDQAAADKDHRGSDEYFLEYFHHFSPYQMMCTAI